MLRYKVTTATLMMSIMRRAGRSITAPGKMPTNSSLRSYYIVSEVIEYVQVEHWRRWGQRYQFIP